MSVGARRLCCASLVVFAASGAARADLLGFTLQPSPDILSGFINVTYLAGLDLFSASGFATTLDGVGIAGGSFDIGATIDDGVLLSGTVTVGGTIGGDGPSLLTGDLTAFGFDPGGFDMFDFLFDVTGGDLAGIYGGVGAQVGMNLHLGSDSFTGSFASDFSNEPFAGFADIAPIPAPGAAFLGMIGMSMIARVRRQCR